MTLRDMADPCWCTEWGPDLAYRFFADKFIIALSQIFRILIAPSLRRNSNLSARAIGECSCGSTRMLASDEVSDGPLYTTAFLVHDEAHILNKVKPIIRRTIGRAADW